MDKLKMHSKDLTQDNLAKIQLAFPNCMTERKNAQGQIELAIDFDLLRQELTANIVEGPQERYRLDWPGKREAMLTANAPIAKTLRPARDESVNFDSTENLFIEGDNLDALKLLQETYLGKVKMIYIDPPYNTGNDFVYEDDFAETNEEFLQRSNQKDEQGNRLVSNTESNGRFHSDWLSMMFSRLKLARNLLSNDGVVFISIDDHEHAALKKLCDEVLGSDNFITSVSRIAKRTSNKGTFFRSTKDYILVYAKDISLLNEFGMPKDIHEKDYSLADEDGRKYKQSGASLYQPSLDSRPNQRYYIEAPDGSLMIPPGSVFPDAKHDGSKIKPLSNSDKVWRWSVNSYLKQKHLLIFTKGSARNPLLDENGQQSKWNVYPKVYLDDDMNATLLPEDVIYDFPNSQGTKEINALKIPFSFAKPTNLIKFLIKLLKEKDFTLLDFFAGSATSAHAVMQLNAEDGGSRKFIMVQLPEEIDERNEANTDGYKTIAEISKERIRRAGQQIIAGECHADWNKDIGFRVLKVDTSNMQDVYYQPQQLNQSDLFASVDNIKADRTSEDLLFQVLLDWGVDLTLPIRRETLQGKEVFIVDDNALVACFEQGISEELIHELAALSPLRAVFRDNGFATDAVKVNVTQIFKQRSPITEVKSI